MEFDESNVTRQVTNDRESTAPCIDDSTTNFLRSVIDKIDREISLQLTRRTQLSRQIVRRRIALGGTRIAIEREREVICRYRDAFGDVGIELAMLVLRLGRGSLIQPIRRTTAGESDD